MDKFLEFSLDAAKAAGKIIKSGFRSEMSFHEKTPKELVSEYDLKSEKEIISRIRKSFPDHGIYSEEAGDLSNDGDYLWVLDPIDGTHNYIYGLPYYGVSIGLLKKGKPQVGVIYLPETEEIISAVCGEGAEINGVGVKVSSRILDNALVLYQSTYPQTDEKPYGFMQNILRKSQSMRILGVATVNFRHVASGCADAYIMHDLRPYDVAAGALIVEEAGGKVTDFDGKPWTMSSTTFLASNGAIHDELLEVLK